MLDILAYERVKYALWEEKSRVETDNSSLT